MRCSDPGEGRRARRPRCRRPCSGAPCRRSRSGRHRGARRRRSARGGGRAGAGSTCTNRRDQRNVSDRGDHVPVHVEPLVVHPDRRVEPQGHRRDPLPVARGAAQPAGDVLPQLLESRRLDALPAAGTLAAQPTCMWRSRSRPQERVVERAIAVRSPSDLRISSTVPERRRITRARPHPQSAQRTPVSRDLRSVRPFTADQCRSIKCPIAAWVSIVSSRWPINWLHGSPSRIACGRSSRHRARSRPRTWIPARSCGWWPSAPRSSPARAPA